MENLNEFIKAGVHFGHKTSRWSPKMAPYIWGSKNKIHLIDISKTALLLNRAVKYLNEIGEEGKQALFVGTKKAASEIIQRIGAEIDMPIVTHRWIGGTLSNYAQVKKAITRLMHLRDVVKKSNTNYTKKELSVIQKEIARLEKNVGGIINLKFPPAAIVVVDAKREQAAVKEALKLGIPVVAMVDTNTDPTNINFVIPANDDSPKSIKYITDILAKHLSDGKKVYDAKQEKVKASAKENADKKSNYKKETVRVGTVPVRTAPVRTAPVKTVVKKTAKTIITKVKTAPVKTAPVKTAPVKKEVSTVKTAPIKDKAEPAKKEAVKKSPVKKTEPIKTKKAAAPVKAKADIAKKAPVKNAPVKTAKASLVKSAPVKTAVKKAVKKDK